MLDETHRLISEMFRTNYGNFLKDNMPVLVRRGNRNTLAELFARLGFKKGVEVGTQRGAYARTLCHVNPKLELYCVDPWLAYGNLKQGRQNRIYEEACANLEPYNATIIKEKSMVAVNRFEDDSLDFVFIDGAHDFDNVCVDLIWWAYKVRPGGIIALHDYIASRWSGVMKAVDGYTHCHRIVPWFVTREQLTTAFWVKQPEHYYLQPRP